MMEAVLSNSKTKDEIQAECLNIILPLHRCTVAATMGSGKTLIGLKHMDAHYTDYCKFLVVIPKKSVIAEWRSQVEIHGLSHLLPHITFTTYLSLVKQVVDYDILYLDEVHSILSSHLKFLNVFRGKILGMTGSPPVNKRSLKAQIINQFCPIAYTYLLDTAVEDKILNDYNIIVHTLSLDQTKTLKVEKKGNVWYTSEQASYTYWTNRIDAAVSKKEEQICAVMRMKALMDFPSKEKLAKKLLNLSKEKIILFANTQKQADSFNIPSYHSKNTLSDVNLRDFNQGRFSQLACVLQLSEGINIKNLKEGIIMHSYSSNSAKSSQRFGRLMRLNPNDTCTLHILCYINTVDEKWCHSVLANLDQTKITWK